MRIGRLGCWCPCLLLGKIYAREHKEATSSVVRGIVHPNVASTPACNALSEDGEGQGIESIAMLAETFVEPCVVLAAAACRAMSLIVP